MKIDQADIVIQYHKKNSSFRKVMIYRLGYDAGFFSEYNNMIIAAIYCFSKNIRFKFNSTYSNFKYQNGWEDYFNKSFEEDNGWYNKSYNFRPYLRKKKHLSDLILKKILGINFFTQDLWSQFRSDRFISQDISLFELGYSGDLLGACNLFVKISWNHNQLVKEAIQEYENSLRLPKNYIGIHVRRGDKINETQISNDLIQYLELASSKTNIRDLFISSDDYSVVEELKKNNHWRVFHKIVSNSIGYNQGEFNNKSFSQKKLEIINLICDVEVLCKSTVFVGTSSSNIGVFVGMYRNCIDTYYIDSTKWRVW